MTGELWLVFLLPEKEHVADRRVIAMLSQTSPTTPSLWPKARLNSHQIYPNRHTAVEDQQHLHLSPEDALTSL